MNIPLNSNRARDIASQVHPQTNLLKHSQDGALIVESGEGIYIKDDDGKAYMETISGLWCASLGFANERLAKVAYEQMRSLGFYHSFRNKANAPSIDLAEALLALAPVPMSKAVFQCSGSEANDTAIKLVWYYQNALGRTEKKKIIGRRKGYHGSTIGAVSLSGKPDMHAEFDLPVSPRFLHVDPPHHYRFAHDGESEDAFATRMADELEAKILEEGPETVAAFFAEPVMGAGGGLVPPATYFEKVQAVLARHDVLFVADEVICGFGRTGNWWGSQTFDLKPDIITCAKALSGAFQPISAILIGEKIYQAMLEESRKVGVFAHGFTFAGHPVAAAVARETLRIYEEDDVIGHVQRIAPHFQAAVRSLGDHAHVDDIHGVGLLASFELVADRATKAPFPTDAGLGDKIEQAAYRNGLILRNIGDRIALAPPLIIQEAEIDEMLSRVRRVVDEVAAEVSG